MAPLIALGIDGDPIGARVIDVLAGSVRIGAGHHVHALLAASLHDVAERVGVAQPLAAVVQRNLCGIEGDATSSAEAGRIGVDLLKIIEPKSEVVISRVVFDKGQLRPAHGAVVPSWVAGHAAGFGRSEGRNAKKMGGGYARRLLKKSPSGIFHALLLGRTAQRPNRLGKKSLLGR